MWGDSSSCGGSLDVSPVIAADQLCCDDEGGQFIQLDLDHRILVVGLDITICHHSRHSHLRHPKALSINV